MALADVEGAKIHFKELVLSHQIASWDTIEEILVSHYMRQFLHEMYKVTTSMSFLSDACKFTFLLDHTLVSFYYLALNFKHSLSYFIFIFCCSVLLVLQNTTLMEAIERVRNPSETH